MGGLWRAGAVGLALCAVFWGAEAVEAQPQVPSSFFGSAAIDGKPAPAGTEVRGYVDGRDCTQLGSDYRGVVVEDGASAYVVHIVHEAQRAGCGAPGRVVTFTVGGQPAAQTATWNAGPQRLDLNAGAGSPLPLATFTAVPTLPVAAREATATTAAKFTPRPPGTVPTDDVAPFPGTGGAQAQREPTRAADASDSGGTALLPLLIAVLGGVCVVGAAAGIALSRRR